jgi:hypothetical protein
MAPPITSKREFLNLQQERRTEDVKKAPFHVRPLQKDVYSPAAGCMQHPELMSRCMMQYIGDSSQQEIACYPRMNEVQAPLLLQ